MEIIARTEGYIVAQEPGQETSTDDIVQIVYWT